eukprot:15455772-Alexandrium_andersonii.AAC.1
MDFSKATVRIKAAEMATARAAATMKTLTELGRTLWRASSRDCGSCAPSFQGLFVSCLEPGVSVPAAATQPAAFSASRLPERGLERL